MVHKNRYIRKQRLAFLKVYLSVMLYDSVSALYINMPSRGYQMDCELTVASLFTFLFPWLTCSVYQKLKWRWVCRDCSIR
jgi:hypothetical protein